MIPPRPRDPIELTTRDLVEHRRPSQDFRPDVVVCVAIRAADSGGLHRCLASVELQTLDAARFGVALLVDQVSDVLGISLKDLPLDRAWVLTANCGSPARARNALLEFVETAIPSARWTVRLDGDDRFATPDSLAAAVALAKERDVDFVLGGNEVVDRSGRHLRSNHALCCELELDGVLQTLQAMAEGRAINELPSCNLLLRARAGLRYPDTASAEDHWLVAGLLVHLPHRGAVLESPVLVEYTLGGPSTSAASHCGVHQRSRRSLRDAAMVWKDVREMPGRVLGFGQEGIVRLHGDMVHKHFYPGILSREKVSWLTQVCPMCAGIIPNPDFYDETDGRSWIASYPDEPTSPMQGVFADRVESFLLDCLDARVVCGNIKRSNFRVRQDGSLLYIDVGNWIVPMDVSVFLDSATRLHSIGVLGNSDEEILRRPTDHSRPRVWARLPGFETLYGRVMSRRFERDLARVEPLVGSKLTRSADTSLLIKCCAMDDRDLYEQVVHLIEQLVGPQDFAERLLLVDQFPGPFLRQHRSGNLETVLEAALRLQQQGLVDRVLLSPTKPQELVGVAHRWFGLETESTHTVEGIPVLPQVWAFDQVRTRYVLQCDVDVLVGRRAAGHDYLSEMTGACRERDAVGIAFNIPRPVGMSCAEYQAPPGEYKPEVRCGLLDLKRVGGILPLPNRLIDGHLEQPWYRALHQRQRELGLRTLRGGSSDSFYIHPLNEDKSDGWRLAVIRNRVASGQVPDDQLSHWDVVSAVPDWAGPKRAESIVILAKGRNTPAARVTRFVQSLAMQTDQDFGVIVIDDASDDAGGSWNRRALAPLAERLTLFRTPTRMGRAWNDTWAIRHLCTNPESMILVVDGDDALFDREAISVLRKAMGRGHDLVLGAMFRPDAPAQVHCPVLENPRAVYGGDVWIHPRAFKKRLFDALEDSDLQMDGQWIDECSDYAEMLPMVEMATSPTAVPSYLYWHERTTGHTDEERVRRSAIIERILSRTNAGERRNPARKVGP